MVLTKKTECIHIMLQTLMVEEKVFTRQHGLNRKTLSIMLNTNEKYLHDMINEFSPPVISRNEAISTTATNEIAASEIPPRTDIYQ